MDQNTRILQSKQAKQALEKAKRIAQEVSSLIRQAGELEPVRGEIYALFDRELGDDEYIGIIDDELRGVIHTNRLREGVIYTDPVSKKVAATDVPLLQWYPRNTGELIIDASCPIESTGTKRYTLRLGRVVQEPFWGPALAGLALVPSLCTGVVALLMTGKWGVGAVAAGTGAVVGGIAAGAFYGAIQRAVRKWMRVTRNIAAGDLTRLVEEKRRDRFHQVGYELNKIVLGMRAILSELAQAAATSREISAQQAGETRELAEALRALNGEVQNIRQGTEQQFAALEEALAMIEEVAKAAEAMKANTGRALELSDQAAEAAAGGTRAVGEALAKMEGIERAVEEAVRTVNRVAADAAEIGSHAQAITAIARQTNLLALNASIEAARAGESGRGFAVVADEVRKLAAETNAFAKTILEIIEKMQGEAAQAVEAVERSVAAIAEGVEAVGVVGETLRQLRETVEEAQAQVSANHGHAEELLAECTEMEKVMGDLTGIAQRFTEAAAEMAATAEARSETVRHLAGEAETLAQKADELTRIVHRFRLQ
ncbi:MAG: methyl-accepting chemotaxis protein [Bacillota bacterium]|nr:hypothetical protein [Bacillota bacterium]